MSKKDSYRLIKNDVVVVSFDAISDKRESELLNRISELEEMIDKLLNHCPNSECMDCSKIVCPHGEPFHFHHDGCPACAEDDNHDS